MLSIVTATLNAELYFDECLDAIWSLPVAFEHIVVDGGSTDATRDMATRRGARVRLVQGSGIYEAMNIGVGMARGTHLLFANADDVLVASGAAAVHDTAVAADASWAVGSVCVEEAGTRRILRPPSFGIGPRLASALGSLPYPHPATVVARDFFDAVGPFDESLRYAADYDWAIRALELEMPLVVRKVVSKFRLHGGNASSSQAALDESAALQRARLSSPERLLLPPVAKAVRRAATWRAG